MIKRIGEAALTGLAGAALAGVVAWPLGLGAAAAVVGGLNGLVSGGLRIYDWTRGRGWIAFGLDSTWSLLGTALGLALHLVNLVVPGADHVEELSTRRNRHVYGGGVRLRGGFAVSMGNVISNAAGKVGLRGESAGAARRRRFVTEHEELHIWQNRAFGPIFHVAYGTWLVAGALVAVILWPVAKGRLLSVVETLAYYNNPFEYWAYRNNDYWPPRDIHPKLGWRGGRRTRLE